MMDPRLREELLDLYRRQGRLVVLTGAGISAESGIPTFRGKEGYWTVGSSEYHPQEMATQAMFRRQPYEVWRWYLYRLAVCLAAGPNDGHRAVAALEHLFGDDFRLVTQNVDGLHLEAGNGPARTYQIHGNIAFMRCAVDCSADLVPVPRELARVDKSRSLSEHEQARLVCPRCGGLSRPHVLWFDECYDERHYRFDSSLLAAGRADGLVIVGSSGTTNLPLRIAELCAARGILMVDVNPTDDTFARLARMSPRGFALQGTASAELQAMVDVVSEAAG